MDGVEFEDAEDCVPAWDMLEEISGACEEPTLLDDEATLAGDGPTVVGDALSGEELPQDGDGKGHRAVSARDFNSFVLSLAGPFFAMVAVLFVWRVLSYLDRPLNLRSVIFMALGASVVVLALLFFVLAKFPFRSMPVHGLNFPSLDFYSVGWFASAVVVSFIGMLLERFGRIGPSGRLVFYSFSALFFGVSLVWNTGRIFSACGDVSDDGVFLNCKSIGNVVFVAFAQAVTFLCMFEELFIVFCRVLVLAGFPLLDAPVFQAAGV